MNIIIFPDFDCQLKISALSCKILRINWFSIQFIFYFEVPGQFRIFDISLIIEFSLVSIDSILILIFLNLIKICKVFNVLVVSIVGYFTCIGDRKAVYNICAEYFTIIFHSHIDIFIFYIFSLRCCRTTQRIAQRTCSDYSCGSKHDDSFLIHDNYPPYYCLFCKNLQVFISQKICEKMWILWKNVISVKKCK